MAVVPMRPKVEIAGARRRPSGIEIAADDDAERSPDLGQVETGEDEDGNVVITIGEEKAQERPRDGRFDRNLAEDFDDLALSTIARQLVEGIDADVTSRADWEETANRAAKYLGIKLEEPNTSSMGEGTICKTIATTLLESATKSWGVARAELLPVDGPVKVKDDAQYIDQTEPQQPTATPGQGIAGGAPAEPMDRDELAAALEADMNWYLTVGDKEYYPDTSRMLFSRAVIGNAFKKVYRCPLRRKPVSVWVKAQDLIISNDCSHLGNAGRITERIRLRQSVMKRMQASGHYREVDLVQPTGEAVAAEQAIAEVEGIAAATDLPADHEHLVYECYCELEIGILDRDETGRRPGYPLPYRVSIDRDSEQVLEIRRNWKQGDRDHTARRRYVKYGFVPGLGFYDLGLIHLVGNQTLTATMIQRSMVDGGLFANFPGGVIAEGPATRQENTVFRPSPGQFIPVRTASERITDAVMPLPYREPSEVLANLGSKIEQDARRLAGVVELPVGEGRVGNTPVGTIMSYLEAVSQVPGAVHKDDHIAQQEEFELLRELIAEEPEVLWRGNRTPARKWQVAHEIMDPLLIPAADPNTPSQIHRLMKAQGLVMLSGMPQFAGIVNAREVFDYTARLLTGESADRFVMPQQPAPPAPPDPKIVAAQIKAQSQAQSDQAKQAIATQNAQAKLAEQAAEAQQREADRVSQERRAAMTLEGKRAEIGKDAADAFMGHALGHIQHTNELTQDAAQHQDKMNQQGADRASQERQAFAAPLSTPDQ